VADTDKRRQRIRRLVAQRPVGTQAELVSLLEADGIQATQASVSRDIHALGLVKVAGVYSLPGSASTRVSLEHGVSGRVREVRRAGDNLLVLKTSPGEASLVALALDGARWPSIAGTVAGDDTVLVACDGKGARNKTIQELQTLVPESAFLTGEG
jgi:transcriptional regulator of arginine metabolism